MNTARDTHPQVKQINQLITERLAIRVQTYHSLYLQYYTSNMPSTQNPISTKNEISEIKISRSHPKKGQYLNSWPLVHYKSP